MINEHEAPEVPERAVELANELRGALKALLREMRRDSGIIESEIPMAQFILMVTLSENPGIGVVELARLEKVSGPTISAHVKALHLAGFVERVGADPADRRRNGLRLSAMGEQKIAELRDQRRDWIARRIARLSPAGMDAIAAAIGPLKEIAE
jgi:DNA-binding MarR family transcriptional regulator